MTSPAEEIGRKLPFRFERADLGKRISALGKLRCWKGVASLNGANEPWPMAISKPGQ